MQLHCSQGIPPVLHRLLHIADDDAAAIDMRIWVDMEGVLTVLLYQFEGEQRAAPIGLKQSKLEDEYEAVKAAVGR